MSLQIDSQYNLKCAFKDCTFSQEFSNLKEALDAAESHLGEWDDDRGCYENKYHKVEIHTVQIVTSKY